MTAENLKMCVCDSSTRGCYECVRCRQTFCMECDRPRDASEVKTVVRYCPDELCQREKKIDGGIFKVVPRAGTDERDD